jgi:ATP/maltotriose-dependent transcriptional regulator MalT
MYMGEFKQALKIAREVLARSQEIEKPLLEIDAYIQMAEIFHCTGKLDQTIKVVKRGKDILKTLEE